MARIRNLLTVLLFVLSINFLSDNSYSSNYERVKNISNGKDDLGNFKEAANAFKVSEQGCKRISYLIDQNIKCVKEIAGDEYWAYEAITKKDAEFAKSIKNLKIICATVFEGGDALKNLKNGILESIKTIVTDPETKVQDEEKCKQLMGYLNALLITETLIGVYYKSYDNDGELFFLSENNRTDEEKENLFGDVYNLSFESMVESLIRKLSGDESQDHDNTTESPQENNDSKKYMEKISTMINQLQSKQVVGNYGDRIYINRSIDAEKFKDDTEKFKESAFEYMQHDYDCYLRQLGIIDSLENEKSVLYRENELMNVENELLTTMGKRGEDMQCKDRLNEVSKVFEKLQNDNDFKKEINNITTWVDEKRKSWNITLLNQKKELFDKNQYNNTYLRYIACRNKWNNVKNVNPKRNNDSVFNVVMNETWNAFSDVVSPTEEMENNIGEFLLSIWEKLKLCFYESEKYYGNKDFFDKKWINDCVNRIWTVDCLEHQQLLHKKDKVKVLSIMPLNARIKLIVTLVKHNYEANLFIRKMNKYREKYFKKSWETNTMGSYDWELLIRMASMKIRLEDSSNNRKK